MKIYARVTPTNPVAVSSLSEAIRRVGDLYIDGYLPEDATLWINADYPDMGMWVLTDRSTHVRMYRSPKPGWVRLNTTQARFAATCDATQYNPSASYQLGDIPFVGEPNSTIVVSHTDHDSALRVVASTQIAHYTGGEYSYGPFTVIDLPNYTRPEHATTASLTVAQAMVNGTALLTYGLDEATRQFIGDNVDSFSFELTEKDFTFLRDMRDHYSRYTTEKARHLRDTITQLLKSNGMSLDLDTFREG